MRSSSDISRVLLGCALIAFLSLSACASAPGEEAVLDPEEAMLEGFSGAPSWVIQGCNALDADDRRKLICGVGSMGGSRNTTLMRSTALARGRSEIARTLEVRVKAMLEDYQATAAGGAELGSAASQEQHVIDLSRRIADFSLSGSAMKDSWVSRSGSFYALVVLDVKRFKNAVNGMKELSASVREAVQKRAEANWGELDEEVERGRYR